MKKTFYILFLAFFGTQIANAQREIYYGAKVGMNTSHLFFSGSDTELLKQNSGMKISSHIGGFVEIVFNDFFSLQPELLYSVKGARFRENENTDFKSAYVFKYITLPVLAKYFVKEKITIEGGPYVSYLLSAKNEEIKGFFSSNTGDEEASIDLKKNMNSIDAGVALGVGYITKSGFYLSTRYEYGILNTSKTLEGIDKKINNGNIMLSAGFTLNY